ncbi:PTS sugar transporter subunit IIB [Sinomonas atrocyanea]|jgi:PTS system ascorbate-specific IIB component|nr:PTS sugar transporter subunit IIB [Sinomonas atrocyanea]
MGIGTSILLKMNTESALGKLNVPGTVTTADISAARGAAQGVDLVLTSAELADKLADIPAPVAVVNNFMDAQEIESALSGHLPRA